MSEAPSHEREVKFNRAGSIELPQESYCFPIEWAAWERLEAFVQELKGEDKFWSWSSPSLWIAVSSSSFGLFVTALFAWLQAAFQCSKFCIFENGGGLFAALSLAAFVAMAISYGARRAIKSSQSFVRELLFEEMKRICGGHTRPPISTAQSSNQKEFVVGGRVIHPNFGEGKILSLVGDTAKILFDSGQEKLFALEIAPIRPL